MNRILNRVIWSVSALVALLALSFWIVRSQQRAARHEEFHSITRKNTALQVEIKQLEQRLAAADRNQSEAEKAHERTESRRKAEASRSIYQMIKDDPVQQNLELRRLRATAHSEYARFFLQKGYSAKQMSAFIDLTVKYLETWMDLEMTAPPRSAAKDPAVDLLRKKAEAEYFEKVQALLGEEDYRAYQGYRRTAPIYNAVVLGLAGAAALEGCSLTPQQGEQLLNAALSTADAETKPGKNPLKSVDWRKLDGLAQEILTPVQYRIFASRIPPSGFESKERLQINLAIDQAWKTDPLKFDNAVAPREK
ncbi:MAG: hypothetical protein QM790_03215 [Nibricoccus sp.]